MTMTLGNFAGRLLLVGCGNMAGAMLDRWLAAGLDPARVAVVDPAAAARDGVALHASLADWLAADGAADWVMLGLKPQQLNDVAGELAPTATGGVHHLQIPAGVRSAEHTSELQSLMRRPCAVFCLNKKKSILTRPS